MDNFDIDSLMQQLHLKMETFPTTDKISSLVLDVARNLPCRSPDMCSYLRRNLEILKIVLKVRYNSLRSRHNGPYHSTESVTSDICKTIIDTCLTVIRSDEGAHDLCLVILWEVLELSLLLVDTDIFNIVTKTLLNECFVNLSCFDNFSTLSYTCRDQEYSSKYNRYVTVLDKVLKVSLKRTPNAYEIFKQDIDNISDVVTRIVSCGNERVITAMLVTILPKLIAAFGSSKLLEKIWIHIASNFDSCEDKRTVSNPHVFLVLCLLAELYFPDSVSVADIPQIVIRDERLWQILQWGLSDASPHNRKQAQYILKRIIDYLDHNNCAIQATGYFWWNSGCVKYLKEIWETFFLVVETLEEKQVHLIKPVLKDVDRLVNMSNESISHKPRIEVSWIFCIFKRIFIHESNFIVKWGLKKFLQLINSSMLPVNVHLIYFVLGPFCDVLNSCGLFMEPEHTDSLLHLGEELHLLFASIANFPEELANLFFYEILNVMLRISWGPVPLFYLSYALSSVPKMKVWNDSCVTKLKCFVTDRLETQVVYLRGAIQSLLLQSLIQLCDVQNVTVNSIAEFVGSLESKESLKRGTAAWSGLVSWLETFEKDKVATYLNDSIASLLQNNTHVSMEVIARFTVLSCDAALLSLDDGSFTKLLYPATHQFELCSIPSYTPQVEVDIALELLSTILKECTVVVTDVGGVPESDNDPTMKAVLLVLEQCMKGISDFVYYCVRTRVYLQDYTCVNVRLKALEQISEDKTLCLSVLRNIREIENYAIRVLKSDREIPPVSSYFAARIVLYCAKCIEKYKEHIGPRTIVVPLLDEMKDYLAALLSSQSINKSLLKTSTEEKLTRDLQVHWGHLVSGYVETHWSLLDVYLSLYENPAERLASLCSAVVLSKEALDALEVGGRAVIVPVVSVSKHFLPYLVMEAPDVAGRFTECVWKAAFELRKSELFWLAMSKFIEANFQRNLMGDPSYLPHLLKYSDLICTHSQTISGFYNVFLEEFWRASISCSECVMQSFVPVVVNTVVFGPVHRRDQRVLNDTCKFVASLGERCSVNVLIKSDCWADEEVHITGIKLLLEIVKQGPHVAHSVVEALLLRDKQESRNKPRYFGDSQLHRLKHRVMQALLLLETVLSKESCRSLMQTVFESLLVENHQPSVRYLQEWLLVRILFHHPDYRSKLWDVIQQASAVRVGSLSSFVAIAYHLACILVDREEKETFIDKCFQQILPWCMGQHFNVRLYSQVCLQRLWELSVKEGLRSVMEKYQIINSCLEVSIDKGNLVKNAQKLKQDFYFQVFHPLKHFSLQTIYYDLPRLSNITCEEWIPVDFLKTVDASHAQVQVLNETGELGSCSVAGWILKATGGVVEESDGGLELHANVQKKITPWKMMFPDQELLLSYTDSLQKKKKLSEGGLVVVASLIDRPPNLGGLSRTCEVFGVSEYVLGSLRYMEDKQFQNLSVSAEKWIPITEVKPHLLPKYLQEKKNEGYRLVAAEQTANSIRLTELRFPVKSLLLLGNEKEGIPANLLPLVDVCVEVPQQGLIRSLNVHVTGAIFIWEYSKQHHLGCTQGEET